MNLLVSFTLEMSEEKLGRWLDKFGVEDTREGHVERDSYPLIQVLFIGDKEF